jgi:hypothetical protein
VSGTFFVDAQGGLISRFRPAWHRRKVLRGYRRDLLVDPGKAFAVRDDVRLNIGDQLALALLVSADITILSIRLMAFSTCLSPSRSELATLMVRSRTPSGSCPG